MWPLHVIDAVFQMFLSKIVPGNIYISAVLLKTKLRNIQGKIHGGKVLGKICEVP